MSKRTNVAVDGKFYFMFSSGEYSDYSVGAFCVCDHEVSGQQWHDHYRKYQDTLQARRDRLGEAIYDEPNWTRQQNWEKRNDPEKAFRKFHGMKLVNIQELRRDA